MDVNKLLKALDDESNENLFNLTSKKILEMNLQFLKDLELNRTIISDLELEIDSETQAQSQAEAEPEADSNLKETSKPIYNHVFNPTNSLGNKILEIL